MDIVSANAESIVLCKQAVMKIDSAMTDIREIIEQDNIDPDNKMMFEQMAEVGNGIIAALVTVVNKEMNEDEFMGETIDMDQIDEYPSSDNDVEVMDIEVEI